MEINKDLLFILKDFIQGDDKLYEKKLANLNIDKMKKALDYIINNPEISSTQKVDYINNSWKLIYRIKPPNPEEFLTYPYIGEVSDQLYPHVKKVFYDFFDETKPYRNLVLSPHIGWGKSFLSNLIQIYTGIHISLLRKPHKYFNVNVANPLTQLLISATQKKTTELLLEPIMNILEASPFFEQLTTREQMIRKDKEFKNSNTVDKIYWTTASINNSSDLTFNNGSHFKVVSQIYGLLGLTVVSATLSELTFFREAGFSDADILRLYNDTKGRIDSRMKGHYLGRSILDSSPNTMESPIDYYIWNEAHHDKTNYIITGSQWKWNPHEYKDITETFTIFKGSKGKAPRVLEESEDTLQFSPEDLIEVPKSEMLQRQAKNDLFKFLKDWAGIPAGNADKIFYDTVKIESVFDDRLKNLYGFIYARAEDEPSKLIWNQIKGLFFKELNGKYTFWYKPWLKRFIAIDQSLSGDVTSIAVVHLELDENKEVICIVDMTIAVSPKGGRINLDAIKAFIEDLRALGNLYIGNVSFDNYQSESNIQALKRKNFNVEEASVDKKMDAYLKLINLVESGRLKAGKNILFKNNLKSLQIVKRKNSETLKIDHTKGDLVYDGNHEWETSLIGINAKDISDSVAGALDLAFKYQTFTSESYELNKSFEKTEQDAKNSINDFLAKNGLRALKT